MNSLKKNLARLLAGSRCCKCNYIISGKQCSCTCLHLNKGSIVNYTTLKTTLICTDCGTTISDAPNPYNA
jgi:hypothetical protein